MYSPDHKADNCKTTGSSRERDSDEPNVDAVKDSGPDIFLPPYRCKYTGVVDDLLPHLAPRTHQSNDQEMQVTVTRPPSVPSSPEDLKNLKLFFHTLYLLPVKGLSIPLQAGNKDLYCSALGSRGYSSIRKLHVRFDPEQKPSFQKAIDDVETLLRDGTSDRFPQLEELHMSGIDESVFQGFKTGADSKGHVMAAKFCNLLTPPSSTPATRFPLCKIFESGYTEAGFIDYLKTQAVARTQPTETEDEEGFVLQWSSKAPKSVLINPCLLSPAARNK